MEEVEESMALKIVATARVQMFFWRVVRLAEGEGILAWERRAFQWAWLGGG
jgi:hypothetical protein